MSYKLYDEFCGCGGSMSGSSKVRGIEPIFAANHWPLAVESHAANFPHVDHFEGDVARADITRFPRADLFWASPACPAWTDARGKKREFDRSNQITLWDEEETPQEAAARRSRALMEEIPRYLKHWAGKGRPVLAGVVENVRQCRKWDEWDRWIGEIKSCGYRVKVIAYNSMHARPVRTLAAPQSRDRLYVAYWLEAFGRDPDWRKWLSPRAWCPVCEDTVEAMQVFKRLGADMGAYRSQYVYRCPHTTCRNHILEPEVAPALVAIDWNLPGQRIGDRAEPLADATLARIKSGITRYWAPLLTPAGGTWRNVAKPVTEPMPARTTRDNDALAVHPLMVPVEGRPGKTAAPADQPLRTQTARNETGVAIPPQAVGAFVVPLRGGGDRDRARPVSSPLATFSAGGLHHGLAAPPLQNDGSPSGDSEMVAPAAEEPALFPTTGSRSLLVPYYRTGVAQPVDEPVGTFPSRDRWALVEGRGRSIDIADVLFRMLEPHEIQRGMAFNHSYVVLGSKRDRVRQLGNSVTPPVAEVLVSALVECISGEDLPREADDEPLGLAA